MKDFTIFMSTVLEMISRIQTDYLSIWLIPGSIMLVGSGVLYFFTKNFKEMIDEEAEKRRLLAALDAYSSSTKNGSRQQIPKDCHKPFTEEIFLKGWIDSNESSDKHSFERDEAARKKLIATIEKLRSDMARDFELSFRESENVSVEAEQETMLKESGAGSVRLIYKNSNPVDSTKAPARKNNRRTNHLKIV